MVATAVWGAEKLLHDAAETAPAPPSRPPDASVSAGLRAPHNVFSHEKEERPTRPQATDFDTEATARAKLLKSPLLRKAALAFWDALDKPHYGR